MAAVPVTFNGVIYPKGKSGSDKPIPAVFVGYAWKSDVEVGGGPIIPPPQPGDPPHPAHPIVLPPAEGGPHPEHPIVLPEPPISPPELPPDTSVVKPPPPEGGWGWSPAYGWGYFPGTGGPGPKRG